MNQRNLRGAFLFTGILLIVFWAVVSSVNNIDAETNITPTLYVTDLSYLPYVRGLVAGPTATATLLFPTLTPTPTATNTPTPTATDTVPPILTAPTLYDIDNSDQDGNYTVAWSAVAGAYYQLMENHNDIGFAEIYIGYGLSVDRSDMAPGEYCYNVRARANDQWSAWSGEKCTTVVGEPEPEYVCEFETLYEGPRTSGSDIELMHDGRLFIAGGRNADYQSIAGATIFDPSSRTFSQADIPQELVRDAAVIANGKVLFNTFSGPVSLIYDPAIDEYYRLNTLIGCLRVSRLLPEAKIMTFCGGPNASGAFWELYPDRLLATFRLPAYLERSGGPIFAIPIDQTDTLLTEGLLGYIIRWHYLGPRVISEFVNLGEYFPGGAASVATSYDLSKLYFSNATDPVQETAEYVNKNFVLSFDTYQVEQLADMWTKRISHSMLGLNNGKLIALGGKESEESTEYLCDIEIYDPEIDKWFKAGSLNIGRNRPNVIQLLNGDIFVYGGETNPGPGYSYIGPPEIGRCELKANN